MKNSRTIEIAIPPETSDTTLELLKATIEAMVALRCDCSRDWSKVLAELGGEGWQCQWHLKWIAEARRGSELEEASGGTLDETFGQLRQLTHLHLVENCP